MKRTISKRGLAVAALLMLPALAGCKTSKNDPKGLEAQLAKEIPLQSSETQVLDYLDHTKMDHSKYHRDEKMEDASHGATLGNVIDASLFVTSERHLVNPSYDVVFRFDDKDRLIGYDVQWLGYIGL